MSNLYHEYHIWRGVEFWLKQWGMSYLEVLHNCFPVNKPKIEEITETQVSSDTKTFLVRGIVWKITDMDFEPTRGPGFKKLTSFSLTR